MPSIDDATKKIESYPNLFISPFGNDGSIQLYSSIPFGNQNNIECLPCVVCGTSENRFAEINDAALEAASTDKNGVVITFS